LQFITGSFSGTSGRLRQCEATFFKRMDSTIQQQQIFNELKRKIDTLQQLAPQKKYLTYNKRKKLIFIKELF
jgi:hypothetical protein